MKRFIVYFMCAMPVLAVAQINIPLIPQPVQVQLKQGKHTIDYRNISYHQIPDPGIVLMFEKDIPINPKGKNKLEAQFTPALPEGAYRLKVQPKKLIVEAGSASGFYYSIHTIKQLAKIFNGELPLMQLYDAPRFAWRGMHLDVSRHFFSVEEVKRYLDLLAMYKMNVFHWHLTDDQGWRIEIKKYPDLTKIGGYRAKTVQGRAGSGEYDQQTYGGFYTQDQIEEVVAYATSLHITIVPEIEMPGHSLAALSAYPQYACTNGPFAAATDWGVFEDVYCAGKEATFEFLTNVLDEVMDLFPGDYLHIGGDECPKTRWNACSACQKRMQSEGLHDAHELQSYFIRRIEKHVNARGKKIIGWDEILEGGLAPNATVMSWRGTEGGIAAARAGHFAVMSPGSPCYFDHYQAQPIEDEPLAICCYNSLEAVYAYEPAPSELSAEESKYILGAQGNVWTEYMPNFDQVTYMALPRMAALAEVLWSPAEHRDFEDFLKRLQLHATELDRLGYRYARHGW
jgi:hexosaminidase